MRIGQSRKFNIDILFVVILFLLFTFSAVCVLLVAINSYRIVVNSNDENANARTAIAYIREVARQHDSTGAISLASIDGHDCIKMSEDGEYSLYIYEYDGYLMELEAKDEAGVTADFGNKILEINNLEISHKIHTDTIHVVIEDADGITENVSIGIKSGLNKKESVNE